MLAGHMGLTADVSPETQGIPILPGNPRADSASSETNPLDVAMTRKVAAPLNFPSPEDVVPSRTQTDRHPVVGLWSLEHRKRSETSIK